MRGFDIEADVEEVEKEIKSIYPEIIRVSKMRTLHRLLYLIIINNTVTLDKINKEVRTIMHVDVHFERHINKKQIANSSRDA